MKLSWVTKTILCITFLAPSASSAKYSQKEVYEEINQHKQLIHSHLVGELFDIAVYCASKKERFQKELLEQLPLPQEASTCKLAAAESSSPSIQELSIDEKEQLIYNISPALRAEIFMELGNRLFGNQAHPFALPPSCSKISQMDMFFLHIRALVKHDKRYVNLRKACLEALCTQVWHMQTILSKDEFFDPNIIPLTVQRKFFTRNPLELRFMTSRIKELSNRYEHAPKPQKTKTRQDILAAFSKGN